jgi:hypothetical protein
MALPVSQNFLGISLQIFFSLSFHHLGFTLGGGVVEPASVRSPNRSFSFYKDQGANAMILKIFSLKR